MADIFGTYVLTHADSLSGSAGQITTGNFPPGTNVYVSAALSHVRAFDQAVSEGRGCNEFAFILDWMVYGEDGEMHPGQPPSPDDPYVNSVYIDNCANITFGVFSGGGEGEAQITVFSR